MLSTIRDAYLQHLRVVNWIHKVLHCYWHENPAALPLLLLLLVT
jgi:hypothetical protein